MHWTVHIEGGPKRVNHAAVVVNNCVYSIGGYCTDENYAIQRPIDVHILNPETYRWKIMTFDPSPSTPFQRYGHTCVAYNGYIYLWGGRNDQSACRILYRFDTKTLSWSAPETKGSVPGARDGHSAVVIRNQMIIFGGYEEDVGLFSQDCYALDLKNLVWSYMPTTGIAPFYRDFHTASSYLDRYILIFGGRGDEHGPFHTRQERYCPTLVILDVERQEWTRPKTIGTPPEGRRSHSAFMFGGYLHIGFGYNGLTDEHFGDLHRFDPETGVWRSVTPYGTGPKPRRRQGCVTLDTRIFLFGGTSPAEQHDACVPYYVSPLGFSITLWAGDWARTDTQDDFIYLLLPDNPEQDMNEEGHLLDHDDMYILDMEPTLKTLCLLKVIEEKIDIAVLPLALKEQIGYMIMKNKIIPLSRG